ncbi:hypothetical protein GCM10023322_10420 [Rugosimonospora acidiphila]|uniref:MftR C-terminal domain-containing protein n=1 Tax=Rugosimonospora acidiphila TaxID=556531 RepID=A0ABP9RLP6_9ACTN
MALAAEAELWDAYCDRLSGGEIHGEVLGALRDALTATVRGMGDEWLRRFLATRGLIARTPALGERSDAASVATRRRIAQVLADALGLDDRDLRVQLLGEFALAAWRCAARDWVRGDKRAAGPGKVSGLVREIDAAFDAVPAAVALSAGDRRRPSVGPMTTDGSPAGPDHRVLS